MTLGIFVGACVGSEDVEPTDATTPDGLGEAHAPGAEVEAPEEAIDIDSIEPSAPREGLPSILEADSDPEALADADRIDASHLAQEDLESSELASRCPAGCYEANVACTGFLLFNTCWCPDGTGKVCPGEWWVAGPCLGGWVHGCHP